MAHSPGPTPPEEFNNQFPFDNDGFQSKNVHQESSAWNELQHAANEFSAPSTRQLTDPSMWSLSEWSNVPTHKLRITSEIPVASFPTDVFADLLAAKEILTLLLRSTNTRCLGYHCATGISWGACDLCFDGLDTVAEVLLNGTSIGKSDNMFVPLRISVAHLLTKNNVLEIRFESAVNVAKARELEYGKSMVWNGDASRVYLRKAQYHWGWDWGPTLVSCGVWRNHATLTVFAEVDISRIGLLLEDMACLVSLQTPTGITLFNKAFRGFKTKPYNDSHKVLEYTIENPELWFPIGTGKQPLYKLKCTLLHPSYPIPLSTYSRKLGIRRLELIETKLPGPGDKMTFYFSINNRPIFCAGSNWIPADSLLSRVTKDTYKKWLTVLVNGNQNMVRVWGGGVYEDDSFYQLCDEMGILVWQDFMFACGAYPAHGEFVLSVEKEAQAVVKRLRRFASVAIFTGNNEDYAFAESYPELGYDLEMMMRNSGLHPNFLPDTFTSGYFLPGSPWTSNGSASSDTSSGDIHQWNVWHGTQEPYQNYGKLAGRFISEFGMQAFPTVKTTHSFFEAGTSEAEMDPVSTGFAKRLAGYVFENVRFGTGLNEFTYATQLMQAEALSTAYRLWKREWGSPHNRRVGGALVWQLNDCWPCVSWSICDYNLNPKPAYFSIKRELAPITLGIERRVVEESDTIFLDVWGVNTSDTEIRGTLVITGFDYESGHNPHKWTFGKSVFP
ncbi:glycoside hydrolase [Rhizoclosmatium globosum]|uniref:beta-mannosidase n=1 Tax=Rhizoclosmatium globosum TaxID=329046 RepID=A0A1Y2C8L0_9FUNG|nr:glycoside hydrolase [Rhizoclosmatium globosum]|eukprot:ORY43380.1 glycoside hydrolase [Rhizoclosmatium globosum]